LAEFKFLASTYFDHDAYFMHHALHVLDAPANHNLNRNLQIYRAPLMKSQAQCSSLFTSAATSQRAS